MKVRLFASFPCVISDRDGKWSDWESWSACTFTCGAGLQTRTRTCSNPSQAGFGDNCTLGHSLGTQTCNNVLCPEAVTSLPRPTISPDLKVHIWDTFGRRVQATEQPVQNLRQFNGSSIAPGMAANTTAGNPTTNWRDETQLNSVETPFKQLVADIVNTYCNYNASNVQQCCQTSSSYSSNPSNPVTFTTSNNIEFGSGTPLEINNLLAVMIVIKYESNNALCRAALASVGRRRRSVILGELELALPQDIFEQIIANPDL
ncbi:Hypothetical predicted protein [Mytilus galloprovincialis]|uniref:Uncharacterized protein n=1 Tax=Mytilus galloprovincialis TaxID=29158 RepID=A0A8B6FJN5_MYTGA|nr:Hypothetical predicted protein [Mytilus galloprovincialis]